MKKIVNLILLSTALVAIPTVSQAQNGQACFMLDANGNPLDLSYLCQSNSNRNSSPRSSGINTNSKTTYQPGVYTVPIKRRHAGIPVIEVKFNDKYVFEMMFDTGASMTVLTPQMAKILKVRTLGNVMVQTPSDKKIKLARSVVRSIETAGIVGKNKEIIISPALSIGLLGQNFFGIYDYTVKRNENVIEFRER